MLACPRDKPANRHLGLGMWGARTHVPPRAETEWTVQVGQYAKTKKITEERVGALKMGCSQPTIRLKPGAVYGSPMSYATGPYGRAAAWRTVGPRPCRNCGWLPPWPPIGGRKGKVLAFPLNGSGSGR